MDAFSKHSVFIQLEIRPNFLVYVQFTGILRHENIILNFDYRRNSPKSRFQVRGSPDEADL